MSVDTVEKRHAGQHTSVMSKRAGHSLGDERQRGDGDVSQSPNAHVSSVMPERWGQPAKTRRVEYLGFPGWRPLHHNLYKTLRLLEASYHTNYTA